MLGLEPLKKVITGETSNSNVVNIIDEGEIEDQN